MDELQGLIKGYEGKEEPNATTWSDDYKQDPSYAEQTARYSQYYSEVLALELAEKKLKLDESYKKVKDRAKAKGVGLVDG